MRVKTIRRKNEWPHQEQNEPISQDGKQIRQDESDLNLGGMLADSNSRTSRIQQAGSSSNNETILNYSRVSTALTAILNHPAPEDVCSVCSGVNEGWLCGIVTFAYTCAAQPVGALLTYPEVEVRGHGACMLQFRFEELQWCGSRDTVCRGKW